MRGDSRLLARIHGTNERISVADYADMVRFYQQLMRNISTL
jgi:carboxypeptidase PM20D1